MKILIISDTHGKLNKAREVISRLKGLDLIIHAGDYYTDAKILSEETGIDTVFVKGNCDGSMSSDDYAIVPTEYGRIFVTHGHMYRSIDSLIYKATEPGCKAVVYGHTHVALYDAYYGMYILNHDSLSKPWDGSNGSYIVLTTTASTFAASVLYYSDDRSKVKGGYIRDLLNYSDRF